MKKEDCIEIGYISKAHGLKGEVTAVLDVYDVADYQKVRTLYLARKTAPLQAFSVRKLTVTGKKAVILNLEGITTREQAENLTGTTLFYPAENLPALPDGNFYFFEVIGFAVEDQRHGPLGIVKDFADGPAQNLMIIDYQGFEVLVPITDEFVHQADKEKKIIYTSLPEGLLELYTGQDTEDED
ncbi:MAG: ribosome maturation factor RimM [Bacteroidia bacterium]